MNSVRADTRQGLDWVARLDLEPHAEGGWFRRIYTSSQAFFTPRGDRPLVTSIYYLLGGPQRLGRLHRNRSDILHFLIDGGPLEYWVVDANDELSRVRMSAESARHLLVPGGCWKASALVGGASHALVAEVVTPGFDYSDHEFARAETLSASRHLDTLKPFLRDR